MLIANTKFTAPASFLGRNGDFLATGLELTALDKTVTIQPLTSKGKIGKCKIGVPIQDVSELIKQLQRIIE